MKEKSITIGKAYEEYFPIGVAVGNLQMTVEQQELLKHFKSLTAENGMKFDALQPCEGKFDFSYGDALTDLARKNHQKMRGHTLVWHQQTPAWVFVDDKGERASRELALLRMEKHIDTVVRHFSQAVYCWDVVNEAIEDRGSEFLRKSPWLACIGEDYIGRAFEIAHRADSKCALFYNDYNNERPEKRDKTYRLLKELKESNIPVHGVGIQGHFDIRDEQLIPNLKTALDCYAELDLQIQITELDVSMYAFPDFRSDVLVPTKEMQERQGEVYCQLFELLRQYREVITGVTLWGTRDSVSWRNDFPVPGRKDWPLLFKEDSQPKEFYARLLEF